MEIEKVFEVLKDSEKRKYWGTVEVEFRGGTANSISKTQKILFDPPKGRTAQVGATESETMKGA